jgi:hypothetical protein
MPGPIVNYKNGAVLREGVRALVFKGALDDALAQFQSRDALLRLCVEHNKHEELCHGLNSSLRLRLSKDGSRVLFKLGTDSERGRETAHYLLTRGITGLSLALSDIETLEELPDLPNHIGITRANIDHISAVQTPRWPGCRITT